MSEKRERSSTSPFPRRVFHIELSRLSTKMQQIAITPVTPTTPSCFTPITPSSFNELKDIFSNQQESFLVAPLPERNTKNRKASFLLDKISQQELLAPFTPSKEE
jgi:hypothetical protein